MYPPLFFRYLHSLLLFFMTCGILKTETNKTDSFKGGIYYEKIRCCGIYLACLFRR